jgi:hypothetical protein
MWSMLGGAFGSGGVTTMECLIAAGVEEAIECAHELMLFLQYVTHVAEIQSRFFIYKPKTGMAR